MWEVEVAFVVSKRPVSVGGDAWPKTLPFCAYFSKPEVGFGAPESPSLLNVKIPPDEFAGLMVLKILLLPGTVSLYVETGFPVPKRPAPFEKLVWPNTLPLDSAGVSKSFS